MFLYGLLSCNSFLWKKILHKTRLFLKKVTLIKTALYGGCILPTILLYNTHTYDCTFFIFFFLPLVTFIGTAGIIALKKQNRKTKLQFYSDSLITFPILWKNKMAVNRKECLDSLLRKCNHGPI